MLTLPKPQVIFTHESDLDGLVAGLLLQRLAKQLYGETVPLEAYHYNFWKQRELRERAAWVTDFTFETRLDKMDWLGGGEITTQHLPPQHHPPPPHKKKHP